MLLEAKGVFLKLLISGSLQEPSKCCRAFVVDATHIFLSSILFGGLFSVFSDVFSLFVSLLSFFMFFFFTY